MYALYTGLLALALLFFYIPAYFIRYRVLRGEKLYLRERLGGGLKKLPRPSPAHPTIWFHAVSVGELISLQKLIVSLKDKHPDWDISLSCLTSSGMKVAQSKLKTVERIFFIPFDFGFILRKYFRYLKPQLLVLVESEYWPNLLRTARRMKCPVVVINARMTEEAFRRYARLKALTACLLNQVEEFLVQTEEEKERLRLLGVGEEKIIVSGNMKCDLELPRFSADELAEMKKKFGLERELSAQPAKILVAGSIHQGEEEPIIRAFTQARQKGSPYLLILAPRHLEMAESVARVCQQYGLVCQRRTKLAEGQFMTPEAKANRNQTAPWDVLILDTIGELASLYALADIVFIGGSLVPHGGHNLLEPAFYGRPLFFGPHMDNFKYLAQKFIQTGGAREIKDEAELIYILTQTREEELKAMGEKAQQTLKTLQGATELIIREIEKFVTRNE
jgi:3-deoxy-D-manno-octulosonic-acid transferase